MKNNNNTEAVQKLIKQCLVVVYLLSCQSVWSQNGLNAFTAARAQALGEMVAAIDGHESLSSNFSNVSWLEYNSVFLLFGSTYRYGLPEFKTSYLGICIKHRRYSHFSFAINQYGFSLFKINQVSLGFARQITSKLSISLNLLMERLSIPAYGHNVFPAISLGLSGYFDKQTRYAILIENPESQKIDDISRSESRLSIGLCRLQSEYLKLFVEAEKRPGRTIAVKTGIEYLLNQSIQIQLGLNTEPGTMSFGLCCKTKDYWKISLTSRYSLDTGINPAASIIWQIP